MKSFESKFLIRPDLKVIKLFSCSTEMLLGESVRCLPRPAHKLLCVKRLGFKDIEESNAELNISLI